MSIPKLISKELHPEDQTKRSYTNNRVLANCYASVTGQTRLELRKEAKSDPNELWRSENNGKTWQLVEQIPCRESLDDNHYANRLGCVMYLDPEHDLLLRFFFKMIVTEKYYDPDVTYPEIQETIIPNTLRMYYQISRDHGQTWEQEKQLIQKGSKFNEEHWATGVHFKKTGLYLNSHFQKRSDGVIIVPYQSYGHDKNEDFGTIRAGRFFGRWNDDLTDLEWESGGMIPGGGCEQASAYLKDGRLISIIRAQGLVSPYFFPPKQRPYSISEDDGMTWQKPKPLVFDDGSIFTSSASYSEIIRSSANGRLYWIGNLTPINLKAELLGMDTPRCDPRYPLYIAEIDEELLAVKKESLTIIDDRDSGDSMWIRYSNFRVFEDRVTQEIIIIMMEEYAELEPEWLTLPNPSYQYRIKVK